MDGRISLRENQSAKAMGRKWPTSITSVAWPLITAEPKMPSWRACDLDVEPLLDDVDDLVDHEPHRAAVIGEHQDRLGAGGLDRDAVHLHQRHQLLAVLHHVAAVTELDLVGGDLFQPGDEAERDRLGLVGAGAEHQQRSQLLAGDMGGRILVANAMGGRAGGAQRLGDAIGVDDHDDGAIAQNGVAGEHLDVTQLWSTSA